MGLLRPIMSSVRDLPVSYVKLPCPFIDEEAKKGPKRRGAPRSAGRTAANTGPVSFETPPDILIRSNTIIAITHQFRENEYSHA